MITNKNIENTIINSVLMAYNGIESEIDSLMLLKLEDTYFSDYNKAVIKARNNILEKNPIVNDYMVEDYLRKKNYLKEKEFLEILSTTPIVFDFVIYYYELLKDDYKKRLML